MFFSKFYELTAEPETAELSTITMNDWTLCGNVTMIERDKQNERQVSCECLLFNKEGDCSSRWSSRWKWCWSSAVSLPKIDKIAFSLFRSMETIWAVILDVLYFIMIRYYNTAVWGQGWSIDCSAFLNKFWFVSLCKSLYIHCISSIKILATLKIDRWQRSESTLFLVPFDQCSPSKWHD
jgi:hypothetical protein